MTLFLYRDRLVNLDALPGPTEQDGFPLSSDQYAGLTTDDLMQLLTEALADEEPKFVLAICHMLYDKAQINAVRVVDDGGGPILSCARIPYQSLNILDELRMRGKLTQDAVDEAVWNPLA